MTWIRKRYTKVYTMKCEGGSNEWGQTISLIGGKNTTVAADTITLGDISQDNQLRTDMTLYQFFRIRGVAVKMFFPMPTDVDSSPVQWANGYSMSEIINPNVDTDKLQTLATYQTGPCNQNKSINRYYNTAAAYRRFGIQYCNTKEFTDGNFTSTAAGNTLYQGALPLN